MLTIPSRHLARRKVEINVGARGNMDLRRFSLRYTDTFISMPFTVMGFILSHLQLNTNMTYLSVGAIYAGYLLDLPGQYLYDALGVPWAPSGFLLSLASRDLWQRSERERRLELGYMFP